MWNIITLIILLHSFLVSFANCDTNLTPLGDVLGRLGPTIIEKPNKVDDDLKVVSDAIKSTKLDPIVKLFGQRTLAQRMAIDQAFQKAFGNNINISTAINNILTGRYDVDAKDMFEGLLEPLPLLLAGYISGSFSRGQGTSHWTYMSIISISSATKLKAIIEAYPSIHGKKLVDDVDQYVEKGTKENGVMNRMLDEKTMRPDSGSDPKLVDEQVKLIPGDCKLDKLMEFMTSSSYEQIKLVVDKWLKDNNNKNIVDAFRKNCDKGIAQEIYKRIIRYAADPYEYLAEELYLGVTAESHNTLVHRYIITARSDIDLKDILQAYTNKYGKLSDELDKWTKGYYVDLLKAVCNGNTGK